MTKVSKCKVELFLQQDSNFKCCSWCNW